jgi:hypothetical protein
MITEIGIVAGDVWHCLEENQNTATIDELVRQTGKPRELVAMALGWLAREGHVTLGAQTTNYRAHLNPKEKK